MKTFAWNKLPVNKIFGKNNIWTKMAKTFEKDKSAPIGMPANVYNCEHRGRFFKPILPEVWKHLF